jgi:hypothetical protein
VGESYADVFVGVAKGNGAMAVCEKNQGGEMGRCHEGGRRGVLLNDGDVYRRKESSLLDPRIEQDDDARYKKILLDSVNCLLLYLVVIL